ncbi:MAG: hypothetical protein AAF346_03930 [Pseudomonadota bacterium]
MAQVRAVFDLYQVGHGCLQTLDDELEPSEALWRVTPDDVTSACSQLVKTKKHPALLIGKSRHFPFNMMDYREHFQGDPETDALFEAFANNGLSAVYALPIRTPAGVYVFVVGRPNDTIDLTELLALQTICTNALNKIVQFKKRPCDNSVPYILTNNQRRVLIALARGMDRTTIARTHCLSEDTVALIEQQIVDDLGAANARHAIVLSLIAGELSLEDFAPLSYSDQ